MKRLSNFSSGSSSPFHKCGPSSRKQFHSHPWLKCLNTFFHVFWARSSSLSSPKFAFLPYLKSLAKIPKIPLPGLNTWSPLHSTPSPHLPHTHLQLIMTTLCTRSLTSPLHVQGHCHGRNAPTIHHLSSTQTMASHLMYSLLPVLVGFQFS